MIVDEKLVSYRGDFYDQPYDEHNTTAVNNTFAYEVQDTQLNMSSLFAGTSQNVVILKNQENSQLYVEKSKQELLITEQVKTNLDVEPQVNYGEG